MAKTKIISYFDKEKKVGYVSYSATQLSIILHLHRNTISNRLTDGYYEDDTCMMFCIDRQSVIKGLGRNKGRFTKDAVSDKSPTNVQSIQHIAQSSISPDSQWKKKEIPFKKWDPSTLKK